MRRSRNLGDSHPVYSAPSLLLSSRAMVYLLSTTQLSAFYNSPQNATELVVELRKAQPAVGCGPNLRSPTQPTAYQ